MTRPPDIRPHARPVLRTAVAWLALPALAALPFGCGGTPSKPDPALSFEFAPAALPGKEEMRVEFDVVLQPRPGPDGKQPPDVPRGRHLSRIVRSSGEVSHCEETRTVARRGESVVATYNRIVFVESDDGRPLRFVVENRQDPGNRSRKYEGRMEGETLKLEVQEGADRRVYKVARPPGAVSMLQLRRELLRQGLQPGRELQCPAVFPVPEEPEHAYPGGAAVLAAETIDHAGKPVAVFKIIVAVVGLFGRKDQGIGRIQYVDAKGEIWRMEENGPQGKIVYRRRG